MVFDASVVLLAAAVSFDVMELLVFVLLEVLLASSLASLVVFEDSDVILLVFDVVSDVALSSDELLAEVVLVPLSAVESPSPDVALVEFTVIV